MRGGYNGPRGERMRRCSARLSFSPFDRGVGGGGCIIESRMWKFNEWTGGECYDFKNEMWVEEVNRYCF